MAKDKALLFDLSSSISFGRLSLKGKVLWPMLLIKSDDQGRGQAEPDWIKWRVCPNVEEITIADIEGILDEMTSERIGLLHVYQDGRGRRLYQIIRWWEPELGSGSSLQWARPSEYHAPDGWLDRIRIQHGPGEHELVNWDAPGGFCPSQPGGEPASQPGGKPGTGITKQNLTQPDQTEQDMTQQETTRLDSAAAGYTLLADFGLNEPALTECAEAYPPERIADAIAATNGKTLANPQGYLVTLLRSGKPIPKARAPADPATERKRKYARPGVQT